MSAKRRVNRISQRRARAPQPQREPSRLDRAPLDLGRATYLTVSQTMDYLQFRTVKAVHSWAARAAVPKCRRGRTLLFKRTDLDKAVQQRGKQASA